MYCIDEPELHLNTRAQGPLLREMLRLVPPNSQLWVATHSIGMMRAARDIDSVFPGSVVFLDFGDRDFDAPVKMVPAPPDRRLWKQALEVALGDLAALVAPRLLVLCEGSTGGKGPRNQCDAQCYRRIFDVTYPDVQFVSVGADSQVQDLGPPAREIVAALTPSTEIRQLVDRDDRSNEDIETLAEQGVRVLRERSLESYLYADEILQLLCRVERKPEKESEVLQAKHAALERIHETQGKPLNDVKSARGLIYNDLKRILDLRGRGNDPSSFALQVLVPLITPDTATYKELQAAIFG